MKTFCFLLIRIRASPRSQPLKFLRDLGLRGTSVDEQVSAVLGIEKLDLGTNGLTRFLQTCNGTGTFFPNLQYLDLTHNLLLFIPNDICLPKLQFLDLSQNAFTALLKDSFSLSKFPSLVELHLDSLGYGTSLLQIARLTFNNPTLRLLSLAGNTVRLSSTAVDPDAFNGCWNLSTLLLYHNDFTALTDTKVQQLFGVLPRLSVLDLRACKISSITNQTFVGPSSLQRLLLSYNYLSHVPDHAFDALFNLTELDLSANRLSMITERTFSEETRGRLRHLDVSNNNFTCGCEIRWFRQWLISDPSLFNGSNGPYAMLKQRELNIVLHEWSSVHVCGRSVQATFRSFCGYAFWPGVKLWRAPAGDCVGGFVPCCSESSEFGTTAGTTRLLVDDEEKFQYDVFVSYAEEDDGWVRDHLMPELGGTAGAEAVCPSARLPPGQEHPGQHWRPVWRAARRPWWSSPPTSPAASGVSSSCRWDYVTLWIVTTNCWLCICMTLHHVTWRPAWRPWWGRAPTSVGPSERKNWPISGTASVWLFAISTTIDHCIVVD